MNKNNSKKNPWLGLASYTEESLNEHGFYGRNDAIEILCSFIRRNLIITMYGRSGIGKTSLLQAGVFPELRQSGFTPAVIRLKDLENDQIPAEYVWNIIVNSLKCEGYTYQPFNSTDAYSFILDDRHFFRNVFASGRFVNDEGKSTIPLLVFDQFEEVLYKSRKQTKTLLLQLYSLIDENITLSSEHPQWPDRTDFRVILSIREDDLFMLEDAIDSLHLQDLKSIRFRLRAFSTEDARDVILKPDPDFIDAEQTEEVVNKIIDAASDSWTKNINTLMLSLCCYMLYEKRINNQRPIKAEDVKSLKDDLLVGYYETAIADAGIKKYGREFLESHLVDDKGRRVSMYLEDLKNEVPNVDKLTENGNCHILNVNNDKVEFIHDQLAEAVGKIHQTKKKTKLKAIGTTLLILILFTILFGSLSVVRDVSHEKNITVGSTTKYPFGVSHNSNVEKITIDGPQFSNQLDIIDCPNLKKIEITRKVRLNVIHCPSLISISMPEGSNNEISYYNCPNLTIDDKWRLLSLPDSAYKSEALLFSFLHCRDTNIKQGNHKISIYGAPYFRWNYIKGQKDSKDVYGYPYLDIPDSVKNEMTVYVPFGYKHEFTPLTRFKAFKKIKELPIYAMWLFTLNNATNFLVSGDNTTQTILGIITALMLALIFAASFGNSFASLKNTSFSFADKFWGACSAGYLMTLFAALAFFAFYWLSFNVLFADLAGFKLTTILYSGSIGFVMMLCCLAVVYKNTFSTAWRYFKAKKVSGCLNDVKKSTSKIPSILKKMYSWKLIFALILPVLAIFGVIHYHENLDKREIQLGFLIEMADSNPAKAYLLAEELLKQNNLLFPKFRKEVLSIKNTLEKEKQPRIYELSIDDINKNLQNSTKYKEISSIVDVAGNASGVILRIKDGPTLYYNILNGRTIDLGKMKTARFSDSMLDIISYNNDTIYIRNIDSGKLRSLLISDLESFYIPNDSIIFYSQDTPDNYLHYDWIMQNLQSGVKRYICHNVNWSDDMNFGEYSGDRMVLHGFTLWGRNSHNDLTSLNIENGAWNVYNEYNVQKFNGDYAITDKGLFSISRNKIIWHSDSLVFLGNRCLKVCLKDDVKPYRLDFMDHKGNIVRSLEFPFSNIDYQNENFVFNKKQDLVIYKINAKLIIWDFSPDLAYIRRMAALTREERILFGLLQ